MAGTIINKAEITATDQPDPDSSPNNGVATEDDQSTVSILVQQAELADLELTKSADKTSLTVGENVTYILTLSNKGPNTATGIQVADIAPSGISFGQVTASIGSYNTSTGIWTIPTLNNGNKAVLTITAAATQAGTVTNKAEVTASGQPDPDSSPNNNVASEDDQGSVSVQVLNAVNIEAQYLQLISQVDNLVNQNKLTRLQGRILTDVLRLSLDFYKRGYTRASIVVLRAFNLSVAELIKRGQLSKEEGNKLIEAAQNIINQLDRLAGPPQNPAAASKQKEANESPLNARLYPNYPNPFNSLTVISFDLVRQCKTQVYIYDVSGRVVAKVLDNVMQAGKHSISWQPKNLAPGIYVLRFKAGDYLKSQQMVIIK